MNLPTYERRFYLGQLTRDAINREEQAEKAREQAQSNNSKGTRQTRVSGEALKNKIRTGEIK